MSCKVNNISKKLDQCKNSTSPLNSSSVTNKSKNIKGPTGVNPIINNIKSCSDNLVVNNQGLKLTIGYNMFTTEDGLDIESGHSPTGELVFKHYCKNGLHHNHKGPALIKSEVHMLKKDDGSYRKTIIYRKEWWINGKFIKMVKE